MRATLFIASLGLLATACAAETPATDPAYTGPSLGVDVAPLSLPGIVEATYALTVKNADGDTVWTRDSLASTEFGDGRGALTYVGPCDATANPHTVELLLLSLSDAEGPLDSPGDYVNPTLDAQGQPSPIVVHDVACAANGDTLVPISLTVMRAARQGFFDFAVEFDDIYCSAKADCNPAFLHHDGERDATAILSFACTSGEGQPTYLYLSDLTLTCTDQGGTTTTVLDVTPSKLGNQGAQGSDVFQWAIYQGREFLDVNGESDLEKCFWNHAIGLDLAALAGKDCTLSATAAASDTAFPLGQNGYEIPRTGSYPFIRWSAPILSADGSLCDNMALNASNGAVTTEYVTFDSDSADLPALAARRACGGPQVVSCTTGTGDVDVTPTDTGFVLSVGDGSVADATFALPEGYTVGASCCAPGCCQ